MEANEAMAKNDNKAKMAVVTFVGALSKWHRDRNQGFSLPTDESLEFAMKRTLAAHAHLLTPESDNG